jgi:TRAP-type mannitol/chloroaromatic compound transport system substrate-binding protein
MHEPGSNLAVGFNKAFWEKLSKADQALIEAAGAAETEVMMSEFNAKNGASLARLVRDQGVQLRRFSDEIYDSFGRASDEVFAGVVAHSDLAKRIHESFVKARLEIGGWTNIADQAYVAQRNRVLGIKG